MSESLAQIDFCFLRQVHVRPKTTSMRVRRKTSRIPKEITGARFALMVMSAIVIGDANHLIRVRTIVARDEKEAELVRQYSLRVCDEPDCYLRHRMKLTTQCTNATGSAKT